jgi:Flp pilus assembly protein TadG
MVIVAELLVAAVVAQRGQGAVEVTVVVPVMLVLYFLSFKDKK